MIKEILMVLFLCLASIVPGYYLLRRFHWLPGLPAAFVCGLTGLIALFHIISYPLFIMKCSFSLLFWIYTAVLSGLLVISVGSFIKNKEYENLFLSFRSGFEAVKAVPFMAIIVLLLTAALFYTCVFCYHPTVDDGYYLARSMEVIAKNTLDIHPSQSWYGETIGNYPDLTDASTLSFFISYLSQLFRLPPAIICRRGFASLVILAHLATLSILCAETAEAGRKTEEKFLFLIIYTVFQLVSEKVCSSGRWLSSFIWQGKAMLMALIFPLLLTSCAVIIKKLAKNEYKASDWLSVFIILTAGISLSTVGLFLPVILFFSYGTAFLLSDRFKNFRKVVMPALLAALPVIICGIISYLNIATENARYFQLGKTADWSWMQQFFRANDIFPFCIFVLGCIYFFIKGSALERIVFCYSPLILFLTFLNPLFAEFVATYVTTAEVYWRLFWLLPVYIVPAMAFTRLADSLFHGRLQNGLIAISAVFFLLIGFKSSTYYIVSPTLAAESIKSTLKLTAPKRMNSYAVSEEAMAVVSAILNDWDNNSRPRLLTKYDEYFEIRQCTDEIITCWPEQNAEIPGTALTQSKLFSEYNHYSSAEELHEVLKAAKVNYICLGNNDSIPLQVSSQFEHLLTTGKISLWKVL